MMIRQFGAVLFGSLADFCSADWRIYTSDVVIELV